MGLVFLLLAVQLYDRAYLSLKERIGDGELSGYVVMNKRIGTAQILGTSSPNFSEADLEALAGQPFVRDLAPFRSNSFTAALTLEQFGEFEILVPMEAIEDNFLDTIPEGWNWEEGEKRVPVMISSDFINLYNSVVAPSMNYPRFTREFIMQYPLEIAMIGKGRRSTIPVDVVGFSDRVLSVLVPEDFLTWANDTYGSGNKDEFGRIIVQVEDPGDPALLEYMAENEFETNRDQLRSTAAGAMTATLSVLGFLGFCFILLATIIFLMAFELTISRSREEIGLLIQLGYEIPVLIYSLGGVFVPVILATTGASLAAVIGLNEVTRRYYSQSTFPYEPGIWIGVWLAALIFLLSILALSWWRIHRSLVKLAE